MEEKANYPSGLPIIFTKQAGERLTENRPIIYPWLLLLEIPLIV